MVASNATVASMIAQTSTSSSIGCNVENTVFAYFNYTTNEYFGCECKDGWTGSTWSVERSPYRYTFEIAVLESVSWMEITKIQLDFQTPDPSDVRVLLQKSKIREGNDIIAMLDDVDNSYYQWRESCRNPRA